MLYRFYSFLGWVGLILVTLLALWAAVMGVMLACWAVQCWNLEQVRGGAVGWALHGTKLAMCAERAKLAGTGSQ